MIITVLHLKAKNQYGGGGKPSTPILFSMFSGYFNYWILKHNFLCNQFTGYLKVWNTFTIKGWHYILLSFPLFKLLRQLTPLQSDHFGVSFPPRGAWTRFARPGGFPTL
jgi:hypothetical protein